MGGLGALLAVLAPALAGAFVIKWWFPGQRGGVWPFALGIGYAIGVIAAAGLLGLQGRLFGTLSPWALLVLWVAVAAFMAVRLERRGDFEIEPVILDWRDPEHWRSPTVWLISGLLGLLTLRFTSLAVEQWSQGLFAWDAFSTWSFRARVWVETGQWVPFVFPDAWLADRAGGAYALGAAHYPTLVSLISAWPALVVGQWQEGAANLPWLGLFPAFAAGLYGLARQWGLSAAEALFGAWALVSLPLIGGQNALAGYADLWLALLLGFAFASALLAQRDGDRRYAVLAILLAVAVVFVKAEGLVWLSFFVPMWLVYRFGLKGWLAMVGIGAAAVSVLALMGGLEFSLPGLGPVAISLDRVVTARTGVFEFIAQEGVLTPLIVHLFVFDTWHLLVPVLLLALVASVGSLARDDNGLLAARWQQAALVWVLGAIAAFYVLFFWTPAAEWVRLGTSGNRIMLHFAPALVFWMMTLWHSLSRATR
jgi:hypothetical protein